MTRLALSVAMLAGLFAEPLYAGWHHPGPTCRCVRVYSVYPASSGYGRRLPGQWWDDGGSHISAPPANHSYPHVDNSHKPWSLIPGDGYIGASVPKVSKDDDDDDGDSDSTDDKPSTPPKPKVDELTPRPDPAFKDPSPLREPETKSAPKDDVKPQSKADEDFDRELDRLLAPGKTSDTPKPGRSRKRIESETSSETSDSLNLPPTPASAGFSYSLFTIAMIGLGLSGDYVRRTSRRSENELPTLTI